MVNETSQQSEIRPGIYRLSSCVLRHCKYISPNLCLVIIENFFPVHVEVRNFKKKIRKFDIFKNFEAKGAKILKVFKSKD
jgi:hypothetical protein